MSRLLKSLIGVAAVAAFAAAGAPVASAKSFEAKFSHGFRPNSPHHKAALQMKEEVEKASNGQIEFKIFHSGQAGSARENFEALQLGSLQITTSPTARISGFVPQLQIFDLPFLFPNRSKMIEVLDGPIGQDMLKLLEPQGVKGVAFYVEGFKNMTANKPLRTLDDFKGFKMRTMESAIIMEQYRALGADPVPVAYLEVYNALQMKMVDGQENPVNLIHDMKFFEVQDYLMLSEHAMLGGLLMYGLEWFNSLPADLQKIMLDAGVLYVQRQRAGVKAIEEADLKVIEESGTKIIRISDAEKKVFRDATLPVHKIYSDKYGDEILKQIYAATQ